MPLHVSTTVVLIIRRSKVYYTASGIVTPVGVMIPVAQQWSKHVDAYNKLIIRTRICALSWSIAKNMVGDI